MLDAASSDYTLPTFSNCADKFLATYFTRDFLDISCLEEIFCEMNDYRKVTKSCMKHI